MLAEDVDETCVKTSFHSTMSEIEASIGEDSGVHVVVGPGTTQNNAVEWVGGMML